MHPGPSVGSQPPHAVRATTAHSFTHTRFIPALASNGVVNDGGGCGACHRLAVAYCTPRYDTPSEDRTPTMGPAFVLIVGDTDPETPWTAGRHNEATDAATKTAGRNHRPTLMVWWRRVACMLSCHTTRVGGVP